MQGDADGKEQNTRRVEEGEREFIERGTLGVFGHRRDATGFVDRKLYFVAVPRDTSTSEVIKPPWLFRYITFSFTHS
jgi:hypothetical protein